MTADGEPVDLGAASFVRVEHGYGIFYDASSSTIYEGTYEDGRRSGRGTMYTSNGVYSGEMTNGEPCGHGFMEYKDGDILSGSFALIGKSSRCSHQSSLEPNPYIRGQPHGRVKTSFADGSFYDGEMDDGIISGTGIYINAMGDRYEGQFDRGLLVKGRIQYASGEVAVEGEFLGEQLHGFGILTEIDAKRAGYFDRGLLHGKGTTTYKDSSRFQGFFENGQRSGHGAMSSNGLSSDGPQQKLHVLVEAPWLGGRIRSGGRIREESTGKSWPSLDGSSSSLPCLPHLQEKDDADADNFARSRTEATEKASSFRRQIQEKKAQIYDRELKKRLRATGAEARKELEDTPPVHFTHAKILTSPTSIEDASIRPGLRAKFAKQEPPSTLRQSIRTKWNSIDLDKMRLR
jgi:hypothetical protein